MNAKSDLASILDTFYFKQLETDDLLNNCENLYRHGDRTPVSFYPNDPHKESPIWTAAPGDLTNLGKRQMYELGQWLRIRYDGFLSKIYNQSDIYVLSSDQDRCIVSASATLAGLYPPIGRDIWHPNILWQPIPVHTLPSELDKILYFFDSQQFMENLSNLEEQLNERNKELYKYLSEYCGQNITTTTDATHLWDTLDIEEKHNLTLPKWAHEVFPKLKVIRDEMMSGRQNTQEFYKQTVGLFFSEVLKQFESYSSQNQTDEYVPKMKMFSGHEWNIHIVLQALDIPYSMDIPYGASIMLELRRSEFGDLFVQLVYRTDKVEVKEIKKKVQCSYEDFVELLKPMSLNESAD